MPLQDLTPQLRTRLNRVEKAVGWFVAIATLLLLAAFGYYMYATAQARGWFVTKINYATALNDATGFKVGNAVKLMGFDVGEITGIVPNDPAKSHGLTIYFNVREPYYGYVWYDSHVKVVSDFLGNRYIELEKGQFGVATAYKNDKGELLVLNRYKAWTDYQDLTKQLRTDSSLTNLSTNALLTEATNRLMAQIKSQPDTYYTNAVIGGYTQGINFSHLAGQSNYCWIPSLDTPALGDRLNAVANQLEAALPNLLKMTNQISALLSNANSAVAHLDGTISAADPILTNVAVMTANLTNANGSLGNWLLPGKLTDQLHDTLHDASITLQSAHATLDTADTNLTMLATDLDKTLLHLSDITSNLNNQVEMNPEMLSEISKTIVHTDDLIQGLKRHWFLRSAFKKKAEKPAKKEEPTAAPHVRP